MNTRGRDLLDRLALRAVAAPTVRPRLRSRFEAAVDAPRSFESHAPAAVTPNASTPGRATAPSQEAAPTRTVEGRPLFEQPFAETSKRSVSAPPIAEPVVTVSRSVSSPEPSSDTGYRPSAGPRSARLSSLSPPAAVVEGAGLLVRERHHTHRHEVERQLERETRVEQKVVATSPRLPPEMAVPLLSDRSAAPSVRPQSSLVRSVEAPAPIEITIGRIEIRAQEMDTAVRRAEAPSRRGPALPLSRYLELRERRRG